jgi:hypothetical protein
MKELKNYIRWRMSVNNNELFLNEITSDIMRLYRDKIRAYLSSKQDTLTEADVIVMIMNISVNVSVNLYLSLKNFYLMLRWIMIS